MVEVLVKISLLGKLSGTFLNPSISSEKTINFASISVNFLKALITIQVLKTSPNVPIWGNPEGP